MLISLRKYKTLKFLNELNSFILLKMLPLSQMEFIKLKNVLGKYNIQIKIAKTKEIKALLEKMYKKDIYTNQFNLQFHGQLYILKSLKLTDCLLNNFYNFHQLEETYSLNNKTKKFIVLSVFYKSFFYKITTLNSICKKKEFIKTNSQIILIQKKTLNKLLRLKIILINALIVIKKISFNLKTLNTIQTSLRKPVFFISKRAYRKATDKQRSDFYSGRHKKNPISETSTEILINNTNNKWNF